MFSRSLLKCAMFSMIDSVVVPEFEKWLVFIYARSHSIDELPRIIRTAGGRISGSIDPGFFHT